MVLAANVLCSYFLSTEINGEQTKHTPGFNYLNKNMIEKREKKQFIGRRVYRDQLPKSTSFCAQVFCTSVNQSSEQLHSTTGPTNTNDCSGWKLSRRAVLNHCLWASTLPRRPVPFSLKSFSYPLRVCPAGDGLKMNLGSDSDHLLLGHGVLSR